MHPITKKIKGKEYLYFAKGFGIGGKRLTVQEYISSKKTFDSLSKNKQRKLLWEKSLKIIRKKAKTTSHYYKKTLVDTSLNLSEIDFLEYIKESHNEITQILTPPELEQYKKTMFIRYVTGTTNVEGNSYSIPEAETLFDKDIQPQGKTLRETIELKNFEKYLSKLDKIRPLPQISPKTIKEIHSVLLEGDRKANPGEYRNIPVYIRGSEWVPTPHPAIKEEIQQIINDYRKTKGKAHIFERACKFHLGFEETHPFSEGNGRVGRELMNLILKRHKYPPFYVDMDIRDEYLNALKLGDDGKIREYYSIMLNLYYRHYKSIIDSISKSLDKKILKE